MRNWYKIPGFWKEEFSSNRSSGYVECSFDKTDKKVGCLKLRKCLCQRPQTRKKRFVLKINYFFFRLFLWTGSLQFRLSCQNVSAKLSNQFSSSSRIRKKGRIFSMGKFFRKHALLDNWNAVLNILPERFHQETEKKSAQTRKLHGFFLKEVFFFREIFPLGT